MKKLNRRDKKIRTVYFKHEIFLLCRRFLFRHMLILTATAQKSLLRKYILFFFLKHKNANKRLKVAITRRCILTNRGRGISQSFGITRHFFREFLSFGILLGYKKAVW